MTMHTATCIIIIIIIIIIQMMQLEESIQALAQVLILTVNE